MAWTLFVRGLIIGLSVAATIGPMAVLCMRRTLAQGRAAGLVTGLGVATADGVYGAVAALGLTVVANLLLAERFWLQLIGGAFLCYLGIVTALAAPAERAASAAPTSLRRAYLSALALTLTNPLTILSFAAIFAGLGAAAGGGPGAAALVGGVFLGSVCWWVVLTTLVATLRGRITAGGLRWVNRASGAVILVAGLLTVVSLVGR